jgi:hypothetical protein
MSLEMAKKVIIPQNKNYVPPSSGFVSGSLLFRKDLKNFVRKKLIIFKSIMIYYDTYLTTYFLKWQYIRQGRIRIRPDPYEIGLLDPDPDP